MKDVKPIDLDLTEHPLLPLLINIAARYGTEFRFGPTEINDMEFKNVKLFAKFHDDDTVDLQIVVTDKEPS